MRQMQLYAVMSRSVRVYIYIGYVRVSLNEMQCILIGHCTAVVSDCMFNFLNIVMSHDVEIRRLN